MRVRNWEICLIEALNKDREKPFDWGPADCGRLLQLSIRACLDDHPLLHLDWHDEETARAILRENNGLEGLLAKHFEKITWMQSTAGDIGTFGPPDAAAGLVVIDGVCVGRAETRGQFRIPLDRATTLFKVA